MTWKGAGGWVISDLDVWRAANLLIREARCRCRA
jgi:hypothetical protein